MSPLVAFLSGEGTDGAGRAASEVLAFDDARIERVHDFIQWLFPLMERSGAQPNAPVLTEADIAAIQHSGPAQATLTAAVERMASFYARNDHWLTGGDHNHLRITRIIASLRLLVGDARADAFRASILARVEAAGSPVGPTTLAYWDRA